MYFPASSALITVSHLGCTGQGDSYGYEIMQTIKLIIISKNLRSIPFSKKLEARLSNHLL